MKIIFDLIKEKRKELVLFFLMLMATALILYLFDVRYEAIIVIALVYVLAIIIYLIISLAFFREENDLQAELNQLKKDLRQENENNIRYKNELKDYFLIWIHQIKTPITSLNLLAESLEEEESEKLKILSISIESYTEMALTYLKLIDFSADMNIKRVNLSSLVKNF